MFIILVISSDDHCSSRSFHYTFFYYWMSMPLSHVLRGEWTKHWEKWMNKKNCNWIFYISILNNLENDSRHSCPQNIQFGWLGFPSWNNWIGFIFEYQEPRAHFNRPLRMKIFIFIFLFPYNFNADDDYDCVGRTFLSNNNNRDDNGACLLVVANGQIDTNGIRNIKKKKCRTMNAEHKQSIKLIL